MIAVGWIITAIICLAIFGIFLFYYRKMVSSKNTLLNNLPIEYNRFISIFSIKNKFDEIKTYNDKYLISKDFMEYIYDTGSYSINYKWVSGLLTGLGIFGTFVGITVGLIDTPQIQNTKETQVFISALLEGMRTAFITSLFGIGFSLVFLFIHEELVNKKIDSALEKQYKQFLSDWILEKPEIYLRDQSDSTNELKEITSTFLEASKKINTILNTEELGRVISSSLTTIIQQQLKPSFDSIAESSKDLKKTNNGLAVYIQKDLPKIFTSLENALNSANTAISSTNQVIIETNHSMKLTRDALEKQNENFASLDNLLTNYVTRLEGVLQKQSNLFTDQMNKITGTAIELLNKTEVNVTKAIAESNEKMKGTMDGLNQIWVEQDKRFKETTRVSMELLNTTGEQVRNIIDISNQNIQSTLKGVNDELIQTSARVQEELKKFREEYSKSLDSYIEKQKEVLDKTLTEHTKNLKDSATALGNELEKDYHRRKEISENTSKTIERIKEVMELQKLVDSVVREHLHSLVEKTTSVYKESSKSLDKTLEAYKSGNEANKEILNKMDEVLQKKYEDLNKYSEEQSQYVNQIISYFASILEYMNIQKNLN